MNVVGAVAHQTRLNHASISDVCVWCLEVRAGQESQEDLLIFRIYSYVLLPVLCIPLLIATAALLAPLRAPLATAFAAIWCLGAVNVVNLGGTGAHEQARGSAVPGVRSAVIVGSGQARAGKGVDEGSSRERLPIDISLARDVRLCRPARRCEGRAC
jgi:hypothetical protein